MLVICRQVTVVLLTITNQVEARLNIILPLLYNCDQQNEKKGLFKKKIKNRHRRDVLL